MSAKKEMIAKYEYGCTLFYTLSNSGYTPDIYIYLDKVYVNLQGNNNLNIDYIDRNFDANKLISISKNSSDASQYTNVAAYTDAIAIIRNAENFKQT